MWVSVQEKYPEKFANPRHVVLYVERDQDLQLGMKIVLADVPGKLRFETEHKKANSSPLVIGDYFGYSES
mgnify:CR=1 FL=1